MRSQPRFRESRRGFGGPAQNCEKNFQMAACSSDHSMWPPGKRHQVLGTTQPSYCMQPFGETDFVVVAHLFRVAYLSKKALPRLVRTKVSASPWKAMIATGWS